MAELLWFGGLAKMAASAILFRLAPGISSFLKDRRVILQLYFEFCRNRLINDRVIAFSMAKQDGSGGHIVSSLHFRFLFC